MEAGQSTGIRGDETPPETQRPDSRRFQKLDIRISLHEKVLALRLKGCTYSQIIDEIKKDHGIRLPKSTISYWTRGVADPLRAGHSFVARPSPELAYAIGVETGDGFLNVKSDSYQYRIRLRAVDRDFVGAFNQAVSTVLGCPPHRLWKGEKTKETEVEFGSYLLHKFLSQALEDKKRFIEHDKRCVAAFIRGFFDSEGCMQVSGGLTASNNDMRLLRYVQELLERFFDVKTTGPHLTTKKGTILTRRGKSYVRNADGYNIYVRRAGLDTFHREVGLTIQRKRIRLVNVLAKHRTSMSKHYKC